MVHNYWQYAQALKLVQALNTHLMQYEKYVTGDFSANNAI